MKKGNFSDEKIVAVLRDAEARVVIETWRCRYNERRSHSSQHYVMPEMAYFGRREIRKT